MRPHERYVPLFYFSLTIVLVAVLLPTALRPPPQQPPTSAALDPNAPPDDNEILLSELGQGRSSTAGATKGLVPGGDTGPSVPAAQLPARRGRCFGDPPRQTESLYSPPCVGAWVGNNGGATTKGVSATEVRIGFTRGGATAYEGPVDAAPPDQVDDELRTYRVYERYFNEKFELYGRRVRFFVASTDAAKSGSARGALVKLDQEFGGMFAVVTLNAAAALESIRRKIVVMGGYNNNNSFHEKYSPYSYSFTIDGSKLLLFTSEYICKQFWGKPVAFSGDPLFQGQPRKYGIAQYDDSAYYGYAEDFIKDFKERCGGQVAATYFYQGGGDDDLQIMTKFKADAITTVIFMGEFIGLAVGTAQATAQGYYPEWMGTGGGGTDINEAAHLSDKAQLKNFVNISSLEMMMPAHYRDHWRAYKEIDPENNPDGGPRFSEILQLVGGIQMTGPKLNPDTFRQAMFTKWRSRPPEPRWTIGGGYGPGDYTYPDYMAMTWWDNAAVDPATGRPGAWRHMYDGLRYRNGDVPTAPAPWFKEGRSEPPGEAQR